MVIAITGPTASGKSTLAKQLCSRFDICARIDIDRVKHFVESGFDYDDTELGMKQWALCAKNTGILSKNFLEAGYVVIVEGYVDLESPGWPDIFDIQEADYKFLLLPSAQESYDRNLQRKPAHRMENEDIDRHQEYFRERMHTGGFVVLDTTGQTVEETVSDVMNRISAEK